MGLLWHFPVFSVAHQLTQERLKTHSAAFDGLLSLIPAKYYYDDATQDQWQQKKKSKDELQRNKRAKLDPNANLEADDYSTGAASAQDVMKNRERNAKEVNLPSKKAQVAKVDEKVPENGNEESALSDSEHLIPTELQMVFDDDGNEAGSMPAVPLKVTKKNKKELTEEEKKQKEEKLKQLRAKLASKIETSRAQRKAPGSQAPGAPKSREQILEERKRKQELRKRKREAEPEPDSESDSDSDSGSESEREAQSETPENEQVLFGNIVFNDGSRVTSDLTRLRLTSQKKSAKGPANKDIKAHLAKLEHKKQKLAQMTPEEQAKYKEKEQWQRLMSHAEGVKVKDDEKLLKKALKRKEKQKLKSEIEWKERKQVVKDTIAAKQKRREENLRARRENKGKKAKKAVKLKKFTGTVHKNKRAGFEGTAKSKRSKK